MKLSEKEVAEILCKQLQLLAEVSENVSKSGNLSVLPALTSEMVSIYRILFAV